MSVKKVVEVTLSREQVERMIRLEAHAEAKSDLDSGIGEFDWSDFADNDRVTVSWVE